MPRQIHLERDVTLASVAKDAISCGAYRTALDNADQIADPGVHDSAVLHLVRDALAYGRYDQAMEAATRLRTEKARRRGLAELCDQAKRFGHFEVATRAALLMTAAPSTPPTPAVAPPPVRAGAPLATASPSPVHAVATAVSEAQARPATVTVEPHRSSRGIIWIGGACGLTAVLWGIGFALHGHNLHEWMTTQVDNLAVSAFLMTGSSVGAVIYDWWGRRR